MLFLECSGLMLGFDRWKSTWSSLLDAILAEKTADHLVVFSSDWFSRQTLFAPEASLFAGFLKDIQEAGGKAVGLLNAPIDNALFPWADVLSRTSLINFLEPVDAEAAKLGVQNLIDIDGCRVINFGDNINSIKVDEHAFTRQHAKTYCFSAALPNEIPQSIKSTHENIHWVSQGVEVLCMENENLVELSTFEKGIRILRESETGYSCSSLLYSSRHRDLPVREAPVHDKKSWLETAEAEVFDELAEAGKCGVFWKSGIDVARIGELRKRMSLGDDADNFFEFLRQTMSNSQ